MDAVRLAMLQQIPLFGGIREDVLGFLLEICGEVRVPRGVFFFHEGDPAESMFVIESGKVEVRKTAEEGELLLSTLGTGDCFGEMALIDLSPRSASVLAIEDCRAVEIFAASLFHLYERDLEQFTLVQMNIARELSRRLRRSDEHQVERLSHPSPGDCRTEPT